MTVFSTTRTIFFFFFKITAVSIRSESERTKPAWKRAYFFFIENNFATFLVYSKTKFLSAIWTRIDLSADRLMTNVAWIVRSSTKYVRTICKSVIARNSIFRFSIYIMFTWQTRKILFFSIFWKFFFGGGLVE